MKVTYNVSSTGSNIELISPIISTLQATHKMNGHSIGFHQLVQKFE